MDPFNQQSQQPVQPQYQQQPVQQQYAQPVYAQQPVQQQYAQQQPVYAQPQQQYAPQPQQQQQYAPQPQQQQYGQDLSQPYQQYSQSYDQQQQQYQQPYAQPQQQQQYQQQQSGMYDDQGPNNIADMFPNLFSDLFNKPNVDYNQGPDTVWFANCRFNVLSCFVGGFYMLYHRVYLAPIVFNIVVSAIAGVFYKMFDSTAFSGIVSLLSCAVYGVFTTEIIRFARFRKANALRAKGLSEDEVFNRLQPSWKPVIIYIVCCAVPLLCCCGSAILGFAGLMSR